MAVADEVVSVPADVLVDEESAADDVVDDVSLLLVVVEPESPAVPPPPELFDVSMVRVHDLTSSKASCPLTLIGVRTTWHVSVIKPMDLWEEEV